jgi:hypothetical protein
MFVRAKERSSNLEAWLGAALFWRFPEDEAIY